MTEPQPQPYGESVPVTPGATYRTSAWVRSPGHLGEPVPPTKKNKLPWILGGVALALLLCFGGCGAILAAGGDTEKPAASEQTTTAPAPTTAAPSTAAPSTTPPTTAPVTTAPVKPVPPPPPPPPTIEEGVWTVGSDVPPGTYRVTAPVASGCYWAITKTGSNGDNIIANDLPSGGRPRVTLKRGQDFETSDCGTWEKIGR